MKILAYILAILAFQIAKIILGALTNIFWNLILSKINNRDMSSNKWTQFMCELTASFLAFLISIKMFSLFDIKPNIFIYAIINLMITRMLLFTDSARKGFNKANKNAIDASFLAFYKSKLVELGVQDSEIDMQTEHLKKDDPIRKIAFDYAEKEINNIYVIEEYNPTFQMLGNIIGIGLYIIITFF